ncbi:hypothetical protein [Bradyrhizobium vignae]|uniref:Uncharacterized protein n=1 Tax=Bradyrhizobium vignae TaxID=1549949 RepID=A0ABS4A4W0_9BRAD|nr:hypothetical protein [Bradyrhizobium vignae]MBP0115448.1 hypothetical protein [Bradyrhizobium vignae]
MTRRGPLGVKCARPHRGYIFKEFPVTDFFRTAPRLALALTLAAPAALAASGPPPGYIPIAICTANAVKRRLTAVGLFDARWMIDCTILAPRDQNARGSVTSVLDIMIAIANKPPKIGRHAIRVSPRETLHEGR